MCTRAYQPGCSTVAVNPFEQTPMADLISSRVIIKALQEFARLANPARLSHFLFSSLPHVASYCVPSGVRVVSRVGGSRLAGSFVNQICDEDILGSLDARVGMQTGCPLNSRTATVSARFPWRCGRLVLPVCGEPNIVGAYRRCVSFALLPRSVTTLDDTHQ